MKSLVEAVAKYCAVYSYARDYGVGTDQLSSGHREVRGAANRGKRDLGSLPLGWEF
jgi:hypothetical protein